PHAQPCKKRPYRRHTLVTPRQAAVADVVQIPRDRPAIYMLGKVIHLLTQGILAHALPDQMDGVRRQQTLTGEHGTAVNDTHGEAPAQPCVSLTAVPCSDRKSTRLNSSHVKISYAVFCLKKKTP